jgi:ABC-type transporter Mla MlaB component
MTQVIVEAPSGDYAAASRLPTEQRILAHVMTGDDVVIDLSDVAAFDTIALSGLIKVNELAEAAGRRIVVTGIYDNGLYRLFDLVSPRQRLTTVRDVPAGLRLLEQRAD